MNEWEISYALSKQVPAMRYRVTLETDYGALVLEGSDAEKIAALCEKLLHRQLAQLQRADEK